MYLRLQHFKKNVISFSTFYLKNYKKIILINDNMNAFVSFKNLVVINFQVNFSNTDKFTY